MSKNLVSLSFELKFENYHRGFSLLEIFIVLFIVGSFIAVLVPSLKSSVNDSQRTTSRDELASVLNALKGYAVANGAFPDFPNDGAGVDIDYQLPTAKLGLKTKSVYNDIIYYDVNDALQFATEAAEATGQTTAAFCTAILAEIDKVVTATTADDPEPRVCNDTSSCAPATISDQTSIAIVLITRGRDVALDSNNGDADRVYESGERGISNTYNDIMNTMTLYEASTYFGCSDDVTGNWGTTWSGSSGIVCANSPTVVLHNAGAINMYASQQNQLCWIVSPGEFAAFCNGNGWGASLTIDISEDADCSTVIANSNSITINAADDTNADSDVRISCADTYNTNCTVD